MYLRKCFQVPVLIMMILNSHCENVVSHMIEPSYGRNLKSKVFSSWATCYMRRCVDNTVVGNDLRLENRKGNNLICLFWLQR